MARRSRERPLTPKARAFAAAYAGPGTGVAAARAAGYSGNDATLKVTASTMIGDPRVIDAIVRRVGAEQWGAWFATRKEAQELAPKPPPAAGPLVKGKGRGTATERIELAMNIARKKGLSAKERLAGIRLAAELEGELRSGGIGRRVVMPPSAPLPTNAPATPPPPVAATAATAPAKPDAPAEDATRRGGGVLLFMNARDAELAR